jgi:hypothetical protein
VDGKRRFLFFSALFYFMAHQAAALFVLRSGCHGSGTHSQKFVIGLVDSMDDRFFLNDTNSRDAVENPR